MHTSQNKSHGRLRCFLSYGFLGCFKHIQIIIYPPNLVFLKVIHDLIVNVLNLVALRFNKIEVIEELSLLD